MMNYLPCKRRKLPQSECKGVKWHARANKWVVNLVRNRVEKHLGYYNDLETAIAVRKAAEIDYEAKRIRKVMSKQRSSFINEPPCPFCGK